MRLVFFVKPLAVFALAVILIIRLRKRNYLKRGLGVVPVFKQVENLVKYDMINILIGKAELSRNALTVS